MPNIHDVTNYIILKLADSGLNQLKLQKLLYYVQAWHLAHCGQPLFRGRFQAWIHGPVNREVYDRFKPNKMLYSLMLREDVSAGFDPDRTLSEGDRALVEAVLGSYAAFTGDQLEALTHAEDPWVHARRGFAPNERCEQEIDENLMRDYYRQRITQ